MSNARHAHEMFAGPGDVVGATLGHAEYWSVAYANGSNQSFI